MRLADVDAYYGDSHVLHRVSFRCGEGRLLGLLGRNGAGKTTSMNVAVGLLPPRRGTVEIYGTTVEGRSPEAIAAQGGGAGTAGPSHLPQPHRAREPCRRRSQATARHAALVDDRGGSGRLPAIA